MSEVTLPEQRILLVSPSTTTDLWQDLTAWIPTAGVIRCRGLVVLAQVSGRFHVRIGIQTSASDIEIADAPTAIGTGTGNGYILSVTKQYFDFDPTATGNGVINTKDFFRLGLLYSSTAAAISSGDCILKATYQV